MCLDGAGEKRAYHHCITGDQYTLMIYSLLTQKCIYIGHDQISYRKCSLKMIEYLSQTGKNTTNIEPGKVDLEQNRQCHCNSLHRPANPKDYTCRSAGIDF